MLTSWRLGRVFGFPVEINLSFLLLLAVVFVAYGSSAGFLFGFTSVLIVCLAFGSVLLHELGHALVARRLGVHVASIELSFLGGAAKMAQMPRSPNHELAIAAAGPAVSLALGGAGLGLGALLHVPLFAMLGWINLVIAGFNMIPALPMDGGRILRALLARRLDFARATEAAVVVARVATIGFAILGVLGTYQLLILAPFLWMMTTRERDMVRATSAPYRGGRGGFSELFRRGSGPYDPPGGFSGGGFARGWFDDDDRFDRARFDDDRREGDRRDAYHRPAGGPAFRRFTVRRIGGRLVIETRD